jgi:hypothetical protein
MSSITPSSMYLAVPARRPTTAFDRTPSRTGAAALLALASLPAVAFGGRPFETIGALADILAWAVAQDLSSK